MLLKCPNSGQYDAIQYKPRKLRKLARGYILLECKNLERKNWENLFPKYFRKFLLRTFKSNN